MKRIALFVVLALASSCSDADAHPTGGRVAGQPWTQPAPLGTLVVPVDGNCDFDGSTTPVCGATLSGSVYSQQRDIIANDITIASGVSVASNGWPLHALGDIRCADATAKITANGDAGSGASAGSSTSAHVMPATTAGVNGSSLSGTNGAAASASVPYGFATSSISSTAAQTDGVQGGTCQGGTGGGGGSTHTGGGAGSASTSTSSGWPWTFGQWQARSSSYSAQISLGAGAGAGGGEAGSNGGGSGASGGWLAVSAHSIVGCTLEAKGGAGAAGGNSGGGGGGGGGGGAGGVVVARLMTGAFPTVDVTGGAGGVGGGNGGDGGDGGECISSVCVGAKCRTCIGGVCTTTN